MLTDISRPITTPIKKGFNLGLPESQELLDLFPEAVLLVDARENRIIAANSRTTELTAYTRTELTGLDLAVLLPSLEEEMMGTEQQGKNWDLPLMRHGGTKIEVQFSLVFLDTQKRLAALHLLPISLREQQRIEQERQKQRWQALNNHILAFQQSDLNQALSMSLQAGSNFTGAPILSLYQVDVASPTLQRTFSLEGTDRLPEIISPLDLAVLQKPALWVSGKRTTCDFHRILRSNGLAFAASVPIGDPQSIIGLVIAAGDTAPPPGELIPTLEVVANHLLALIQKNTALTGIRNQFQSQRQQISLGDALRNAVQDGVILVSPDYTILDMNPAAEEMLGYTSKEVIEHLVDNILVCEDKLISSMDLTNAVNGICDLGNITVYRRDGRGFPAHIVALPLWDEKHLDGLSIILEDLSQEEQYRVRTQQLEQRALLGDITAVFAHEVRNPINNISTGLQLMAMNLPTSDANQEVISRLQQDCDRLADLMKSVLAFARPIEPNKMEPVDLGMLITRLRDRWKSHMIRVHVDCLEPEVSPNTKPILGDIRGLEQVFTNLISNAVQAMSDTGGTLIIKVRTPIDDPNRTEVLISDSGPGIPDDVRDRIFEPFFTTKRGGTGLGLSITKQIVTAHKGTIIVTSVPGGTAFQVQFPATLS